MNHLNEFMWFFIECILIPAVVAYGLSEILIKIYL
jgi:hypothetical protein